VYDLRVSPSWVEDRVEKIPEAGCWIWTRTTNRGGYGQYSTDGRTYLAHRLTYETLVSAIPDGLVIDHLCRTPSCVNPDHLEPVTTKENLRRGVGVNGVNSRKTLCHKGHPLELQSAVNGNRGWRYCPKCKREKAQINEQTPKIRALRAAYRLAKRNAGRGIS